MTKKQPRVSMEAVRGRIALMRNIRLVEIAAAVVLLIGMAAGYVSDKVFMGVGLLLFMAILGGSIAIGKMKAEVGE